MKKKLSLLVLFFCIFLTAEIKVDAATSCGKRYFPSAGTYVDYYLDNGYCYPSGKIMASARGILASNKWDTYPVSVSCSYKTCKYKYICSSCPSAVVQSCYKATASNRIETSKLKWYNNPNQITCINAWYDTPPMYATKFKETTEMTCLREKKGNRNANLYSKGFKYATDSYGYEKVKESVCTGSGTGGSSSSGSSSGSGTGGSSSSGSSSGSSCPNSNLYQGCAGSNVKTFQTKLNAVQKCGLDVDGSYGPSTKSCVIAFQKANGLDADGIAGPKTISALDAAYSGLQQESSSTSSQNKLLKYYNITYDTNGGSFINGETKRVVYYLDAEVTIAPSTIPGMKGYKFLGWYNGNTKYVFGSKLTGNITLTAKYEKTSTTKYCLEGDILDIDNNQCITAQEFPDEDANKFYMTGNNKKQTIQTIYNFTRSCPNNVYTVTKKDAVGSNNSVACDSENGYIRDTWRATSNCYDNTTCPLSGTEECNHSFRGTCYASYQPGDTALAEEPDSDNTYEYNKDIKNNATESPQTGGGIIALILVTLSIVGLAIYCYNVYNKKSEEV